jgi:hypothetical protein
MMGGMVNVNQYNTYLLKGQKSPGQAAYSAAAYDITYDMCDAHYDRLAGLGGDTSSIDTAEELFYPLIPLLLKKS